MYCSKCGNKIEKDSVFCGKCGKSIKENKATKKIDLSFIKKKLFIIPCVVIIVAFIIYLIIFNIGKSNLSSNLLSDWYRVETRDSGSIYKLELDFSKDKIEYNFISGYSWLNSTIADYDYKIISPSKIKIKDKTYKIEFNEDKTMMTITPALTSADSSEDWFNVD